MSWVKIKKFIILNCHLIFYTIQNNEPFSWWDCDVPWKVDCDTQRWPAQWWKPSSVQFIHSVMSDSLRPHGLKHTGLPCSSPAPRVSSNSYPSSQWCHSTISSSVIPFSSCLQYFPESQSFSTSRFFLSGDQSFRASASVLPMNIQDWFPLGLTGWIFLQSKGLSRALFNTIQKYQFFGTQLSLGSDSHIHTWLLGNHSFD